VADIHEQQVRRIVAVLVDARTQAGHSQRELARRCGLSRTGLSSIESGLAQPTVLSLLKIADALEVELSEVIAAGLRDI